MDTTKYTLKTGMPDLEAYMKLREESGLDVKSREQSEAALTGAWFSCHIVHNEDGEVASMGRLVSCGDWYYIVADIATLPNHQRQGLGYAVMERLMKEIDERAFPNPFISLDATPGGARLYSKFGFKVSPAISMIKND